MSEILHCMLCDSFRRYFINKSKQTKSKWVKAIILCLLGFMQKIVET